MLIYVSAYTSLQSVLYFAQNCWKQKCLSKPNIKLSTIYLKSTTYPEIIFNGFIDTENTSLDVWQEWVKSMVPPAER